MGVTCQFVGWQWFYATYLPPYYHGGGGYRET